MDLKTFVSETLTQIMEGVRDARERHQRDGDLEGVISPQYDTTDDVGREGAIPLIAVNFDVAVTVSEGGERKAGIAVVGGIMGLGGNVQSTKQNESISRITFKVPVVLPGSWSSR